MPAKEKFSNDPNQPIAVVYGWLLAKSRHLEKFGHFYNNYGADVVTVKPNVTEVRLLHVFCGKVGYLDRVIKITKLQKSYKSSTKEVIL